MTLFIHPTSELSLKSIGRMKPHALILSGPKGIGLSTIAEPYAKKIAKHVTTVLPEKDEKIDLEKGTISVESIRRLYDSTKTVEPEGRVIIIDYAERMAIPAQNAFLKLLEEPGKGTHFMLLTHQPELLLPTVISRSSRVDIRPATLNQSNELLDELNVSDAQKRTQLLFIAEGLPAELHRLVKDDAYFAQRVERVKDARELVTSGGYSRLLIAKKYKDNRQDALMVLEDAMKLVRRTLANSGDTSSLRILNRLVEVHRRLSEQGNVRLQLSSLVMV